MNQKILHVLIEVIYMAACSGFYYLGARAFIRIVGFLGRTTRGSFGLRYLSYFIVWMVTSAAIIVPFFVAMSFYRPFDLVWAILLCSLFVLSLLPAYGHVSKNMEVLYEAGYAKRR